MNMFERASRCKLRFPSKVGELTTEQLWDLPLTHKSATSLDGIAMTVHRELKDLVEVSFVAAKPDPRKDTLELQLDILKHIIASKQAAADAAQKALETRQRKERLLAALASKEEKELEGMTREQIEAEIAKLGT